MLGSHSKAHYLHSLYEMRSVVEDRRKEIIKQSARKLEKLAHKTIEYDQMCDLAGIKRCDKEAEQLEHNHMVMIGECDFLLMLIDRQVEGIAKDEKLCLN